LTDDRRAAEGVLVSLFSTPNAERRTPNAERRSPNPT
jgi:hypothetical protein